MESKHISAIDIAKGIGIICVVVGHCIPDASSGQIMDPFLRNIFHIIYSFHMPLFFFLSGLFIKPIFSNQETVKFIKKRTVRLMVPYFFVGLAYLPFKMLLSSFANKPYNMDDFWKIIIGVNPDGELWFLYTLFMVAIGVAILLKNQIQVYTVCLSLLLVLVAPLIPLPDFLQSIFFYQFFYILGGVNYKKKEYISFFFKKYIGGSGNFYHCQCHAANGF